MAQTVNGEVLELQQALSGVAIKPLGLKRIRVGQVSSKNEADVDFRFTIRRNVYTVTRLNTWHVGEPYSPTYLPDSSVVMRYADRWYILRKAYHGRADDADYELVLNWDTIRETQAKEAPTHEGMLVEGATIRHIGPEQLVVLKDLLDHWQIDNTP